MAVIKRKTAATRQTNILKGEAMPELMKDLHEVIVHTVFGMKDLITTLESATEQTRGELPPEVLEKYAQVRTAAQILRSALEHLGSSVARADLDISWSEVAQQIQRR